MPFLGYSQFIQGERLPIDMDINSARITRSGDIDGDGDLDIVSSSFLGMTWYENLDGLGTFSSPNIFSIPLGQVLGTTVSDLDGDGDLDVTVTAFDLDEVYWFENLDGLGTFSALRLISNQFMGPIDIITADLDGDTDLDIAVTSDVDNILSWFENTDGQGTFGPQQIVTTVFANGRSVVAGDIDGDGDVDLVSASQNNTTIVWFENLDGLGGFNSGNIIENSSDGFTEISIADLDNDGDLDVLSAIFNLDSLAWFENLDGLGNYGPRQVIATSLDAILTLDTADLDNDGDLDVLAGAADFFDGGVFWFENLNGQGDFSTAAVIDTPTPGVRTVHAADVDGDSDIDVVVPILADNVLVWYRNQTILGVDDTLLNTLALYPNPVIDLLYLDIPPTITISDIIIYDTLGRKLRRVTKPLEFIDMSSLQRGLFVLEIRSQTRVLTKKVMVR